MLFLTAVLFALSFWPGGAVVGAFYVLRGDTYVRINVGGYRTEQERIEKSTLPAQSVLQQLGRK